MPRAVRPAAGGEAMRRPPREVRVYEVGGAVRDGILGLPVSDRDWVVVGATPEMMLASGYTPVGNDFPVFLHPATHEEHALARTERKHGTGYRGFEFFASPDVTLEQDLERRDLTINAMARDESGNLIDPFDGRGDLARGILRHVSPAFAEDPLRVLRVARFAARFGFRVAPETQALMRELARSGELATIAPERVWRELARGLMEARPSRMLEVLRDCGALAMLLPEVDALFEVPLAGGAPGSFGGHLLAALDHAAAHARGLPVRYAVLAQRAAGARGPAGAATAAALRAADRMSARLKVPLDCRDAARLAARFRRELVGFDTLAPAAMLDLITACDALRRPERLAWVADAAEADACAGTEPGACAFGQAALAGAARDVVAGVDAGAVAAKATKDARAAKAAGPVPVTKGTDPAAAGDRVARAVRAARLRALRGFKAARAASRAAAERQTR